MQLTTQRRMQIQWTTIKETRQHLEDWRQGDARFTRKCPNPDQWCNIHCKSHYDMAHVEQFTLGYNPPGVSWNRCRAGVHNFEKVKRFQLSRHFSLTTLAINYKQKHNTVFIHILSLKNVNTKINTHIFHSQENGSPKYTVVPPSNINPKTMKIILKQKFLESVRPCLSGQSCFGLYNSASLGTKTWSGLKITIRAMFA